MASVSAVLNVLLWVFGLIAVLGIAYGIWFVWYLDRMSRR